MYNLLTNGFNFGAPLLIAIFVISVWDLIWKLFAMWKAAKKNSVVWFVVLMIFNTAGILPILYIYVFSEMKKGKRRKNLSRSSVKKKGKGR